MSLHDIDKTNDTRTQPKPNTNDNVLERMAHNTTSTTYRKDTATNRQRITFKNGLILTYDQDNKVSSVYGYLPNFSSTPVLIIAKAGYDVFTDILGVDAPTT